MAVLTPYREQVRLLQQRLTEHADQVFTVDGFQGREAEVVVVSLVRDRVRPNAAPYQNVGHVSDRARTNVLLSRAREVLVVVGRLDVYAHSAGPFWAKVAERFRDKGRIVRADVVI